MTAIQKLVRIAETVSAEGGDANQFAIKIKARKKADLKVVSVGTQSLIVATDEGDTLRITPKSDEGFGKFLNFLKRKSSVLLPKMELVADAGNFQIFKTERLVELNEVVTDSVAMAFGNWISNYAEQRKTGRAVRGAVEAAAPAEIAELVHVGNFRGMVNKLVQFAPDCMDLCPSNFMLRKTDAGMQLVVNDPYRVSTAAI